MKGVERSYDHGGCPQGSRCLLRTAKLGGASGKKRGGINRVRLWLGAYLFILHLWLVYHVRMAGGGVWSEASLFAAGDAHSLPGWKGNHGHTRMMML